MDAEVLLPYLLLAGVALAGLVSVVIGVGASLSHTRYFVFVYLAILFLFPGVDWGALPGAGDIYSRGSGQLFFSLVNLTLFGLCFAALLRNAFRTAQSPDCPLLVYLWLFNLLFFGHLVIAAVFNVPLKDAASYTGVLNVLNLTLLVYLITRSIDDQKGLEQLALVLVLCALGRGLYGTVRYLFFGGDPVNAYANLDNLDITITFFDNSDSMIATMAAYLGAARLISEWRSLSTVQRTLYALVVGIGVFVVVFSFRRTNWGGLALAGLLLALTQPWRVRIFALGLIAVSIPTFLFLYEQRVSAETSFGLSALERILSDMGRGGELDLTGGRFAELAQAYDSIKDSWLFGLGSWGEFAGHYIGYHFGRYDYVHSGVGHIWLKTGLVGVALLTLALVAYVRGYLARRARMPLENRSYADAAFAGFLFFVPNLLFGTPIPDYRLMQLLGLTLALPFVAAWVGTQVRLEQ
jgi:O-antigen ligase